VEPADREKVREAAPPHRIRILLVDRILVARRERRSDPAGGPRESLANMLSQPFSNVVETMGCTWRY
jgi:hypothetical protein